MERHITVKKPARIAEWNSDYICRKYVYIQATKKIKCAIKQR